MLSLARPGHSVLPIAAVIVAAGLAAAPGAGAVLFCNGSAQCRDNNVCTVEYCVDYCRYRPLDCNDHDPCTSDTCDPGSGCVHAGEPCGTTTTTLGPPPENCGDADDNGLVTAADALAAMRTAVGASAACTPCVCDVSGEGLLSVTDAHHILRFAVGVAVPLTCGPC